MTASIINCADPDDADVLLLGIAYDRTSSFGKGAAKGPDAILACLDRQIELYESITRTAPAERMKIAAMTLGNINDFSPVEMVAAVEKVCAANRPWTIALGGDHSISNGIFRALAARHDPKEVTVLQIDAHYDLRHDDTDFLDEPYGIWSHACVMRRAHELGFPIVSVGIRAYSKEEDDYARRSGIRTFKWELGKRPTLQQIVSAIRTSKCYVTVDVDGIDPAHMPATGTPVQGGLEWRYVLRLLRKIFRSKNVIGADIVEVAPRPGCNLTEWGAAQLCYKMIALRGERTK